MSKEMLLAPREPKEASVLSQVHRRCLAVGSVAVVCWMIVLHFNWISLGALTETVTLAGLTFILLLTAPDWYAKASARLGLGLLVSVAVLASVFDLPFSLSAGAGSFDTVILLLLGIGVMRVYLQEQNVAVLIERALRHQWIASKPRAPFIIYGGLTFFLSLAVVPLVGTLTRKTSLDYHKHVRTAMRAVGATMFLLPTTVGAAAVSVMFPDLSLGQAVLLGAPLALATIMLTRPARPSVETPRGPALETHSRPRVGLPLGIFLCVFVVSQWLLGQTTVTSVALALVIAGTLSLVACFGMLQAIQALQGSFRRSGAEIFLFLACGTFQAALTGLDLNLLMQMTPASFKELLASASVFSLVIIGGLPLLTIFGIHPMILFAGLFPLLHPFTEVAPAIEYLTWIAMFVVAQLVSPVSISAVSAASSIDESTWNVSFVSHGRFAVVFVLFCVIYFPLITAHA
ncbi:hypothetical protein [Modicisalibacter xianhensis]|nr:hypothetical protein [Halomonas xianhensis]